jgi:hypothetical protein
VFTKDRETDSRINKDQMLGKRRKEITDMKEIKVEKKPHFGKNKKFEKGDGKDKRELKKGGEIKGKDGRVQDKNALRKGKRPEGGSARGGRGGSRGGRGGRGGSSSRGGRSESKGKEQRKGNRNSSHVHKRPTKK